MAPVALSHPQHQDTLVLVGGSSCAGCNIAPSGRRLVCNGDVVVASSRGFRSHTEDHEKPKGEKELLLLVGEMCLTCCCPNQEIYVVVVLLYY
jgi:hypothetical protein